MRKKSNEKFKEQEYAKDQHSIVDDNPENITLKKKLLQAIQDLPEQQKMVIKLFYLEEYTLKEISKTLKMSLGTVKSRLFYAREKLKKNIKK